MYVFPHIGRLSIETVTVKDVARCFVDIWRDKHPVATKTRCIVSKIFQRTIANGIRKNQTNPADTQGGLAVLLDPLSNHLKKTPNQPPGFFRLGGKGEFCPFQTWSGTSESTGESETTPPK